MNAIICIENLIKDFGNKRILDNLNLEIQKGDFCIITGKSGSGKTTLLNIIAGYDYATYGSVIVNNQILNKRNSKKIRTSEIGFIFQNYNLLNDRSIYDNIMLPTIYNYKKKENNFYELINLLNLNYLNKYEIVKNLSGGEKQRVAIARALMLNPSILIADEPTGNLDKENALKVINTLCNLNHLGLTIVMVTHDISLAIDYSFIFDLNDYKIQRRN